MMDKKLAAKLMLTYIFGLMLVGLTLLICTELSHCSTSKPRPNSLGVVQEYTNPNTYLFAEPVEVTVMRDEKDRSYTNVRFMPYNTAAYFDETVLFCGVVSDWKPVPVVVTYRTQASRMYRGIACHDFISTFEVK